MPNNLKEHVELLDLENQLRIVQGAMKDLRRAADEALTEVQKQEWLAEEPGLMAEEANLKASIAKLRAQMAEG